MLPGNGRGGSTEATAGFDRHRGGMTMYLPNHDVRPTGAEAGEFIDAPLIGDPSRDGHWRSNSTGGKVGAEGRVASPTANGGTMDHADAAPFEPQLRFLRELIEENAWIAGDVLPIGWGMWAVHGVIPVDGDVLMAEFDSYDHARHALDELHLGPSTPWTEPA